jgi:seryl-tRNA synthetase
MPLLSPEALKILMDSKDPAIVAETEKLKKMADEQFIPKSRFDEVNEKAKTAEQKLAEIELAAQKAEQDRLAKQGEFQKIAQDAQAKLDTITKAKADTEAKLKAEQEIGNQWREDVKNRKEEAKKELEPLKLWLPEYETDAVSIKSIELVLNAQREKVGTVTKGAGGTTTGKPFHEMTLAELEAYGRLQ